MLDEKRIETLTMKVKDIKKKRSRGAGRIAGEVWRFRVVPH